MFSKFSKNKTKQKVLQNFINMAKKSSIHTQSLKIPKTILNLTKLISFISTKLTVLFAAKLFTTPIKHKTPRRETKMDLESIQKLITVPTINKRVVVYEYGKNTKRVLLVHGWSGRGTQLVKIADQFLVSGFSTVSFDAPAHGKSPGNDSLMIDFIASILEIDKQYGPFEAAIGHSLGGMAVLNAIQQGLNVKSASIIGSGDIVRDIIDDFIKKLELKPTFAIKLQNHFESKYLRKMDDFSAYKAAKKITIPVLVIHDEDDPEVPVKCGMNIYQNSRKGELFLTKGLGHRKILGDNNVVDKIITFTLNH
jgi:pimeloyl-ACP methyl ester carboxylesterase